MQRRLYLLLSCIFIIVSAKAQQAPYKRHFMDIEIQGGATINNIHGISLQDLNYGTLQEHVGFNYGVAMNFNFTPMIAMRNEVLLDRKGALMSLRTNAEGQNPQNEEYLTLRQNLDYLNMPVMTRISLGRKKLQVYVDVGTYLSLLLGGKETTQNEQTGETNQVDNSFDFTQYDWGLLGSAGIMYHINSLLSINIRGKYNHGLQELDDDNPLYEGARNSSISINTGLVIKF